MDQALAALLGAVVGGLFTLAGALAVELRRDRRRQIGAARLVASELERTVVELDVRTDDPRGREDAEATWFEGPHERIRTDAWRIHAVEFVGRLSREDFERVDHLHHRLSDASDFGFTLRESQRMLANAAEVLPRLAALGTPTSFDRHVWRL